MFFFFFSMQVSIKFNMALFLEIQASITKGIGKYGSLKDLMKSRSVFRKTKQGIYTTDIRPILVKPGIYIEYIQETELKKDRGQQQIMSWQNCTKYGSSNTDSEVDGAC